MSSHSESERCSKSTVECDTNHRIEDTSKYTSVSHVLVLFRMFEDVATGELSKELSVTTSH